MGFSEKYDESLYSDKENELICEIIEKFKINKDNILCDTKNKYHFKTGFKRGTYPNLAVNAVAVHIPKDTKKQTQNGNSSNSN